MTTTRRALAALLLAGAALLAPSCAWDGHLDLLGYSTRPNYDTRFRTVRVPMVKNRTYWTVTPAPGMEMDMHRALVREIQTKTPYKVAQCDADTELVCTIVGFQKNMLTYTQYNTVRDAETVMTVELYWRDLRTGEILTKRARRFGEAGEPEARQPLLATPDSLLPAGSKPVVGNTPTAPTSGAVAPGGGTGPTTNPNDENPIDPATRDKAVPMIVRSVASFKPELGESITTAMQKNIDRMAVQIVSAMESGW